MGWYCNDQRHANKTNVIQSKWEELPVNKSLLASCHTLFIAAVFAAASVLAGATPAGAAMSKLKMIFSTAPTTYGIPYYIATDKGWFKDMDLEVEDIYLTSSPNAIRAMVSGTGDVTLLAPSTTMLSILGGADIKVIGSWQPRVDYQLISSKKGKITKITDLLGKTLAGGGGVGMINHMTTMILKKHGHVQKRLKYLPVGGHADRIAAVLSDKADFTLVNTLTASRASDQINWITPVAKELGALGYVYLAVKGEDLKDPVKREAFTKFMKGSIMGARYAIQHPDEAAAAMHKRTPDIDLALIKMVVGQLNAIPVWGVDGGVPNEVTDFTASRYLEYGVLKKAISTDQVLDTSIVEPIIKELGSF